MARRARNLLFTIVAAAALTGMGVGAFAQETPTSKIKARLDAAAQKIQSACADDIAKFCGNVTKGEGRVIHCMLGYEDQISPRCDFALYEASRNMQRALNTVEEVANACWDVIQKQCANIPEGGGNVAQCLAKNKTSIKKGCRTAVERLSAR